MIELEVKEKVLKALKQSFPKPANSAERALKKYVSVLEEQLNKSQLMGRNGIQIKNNWFHISLYKQRNNAGQIGKDKIRLQNWLEQNNLELFKVLEKGSNFNQKLSLIKLSKLVTIKQTASILDDLSDDAQIHDMDDEAFLLKLYPQLDQLTEEQIREQYDIVPVDRQSLKNYIRWLNERASLISSRDKERLTAQATQILRVADYTNGNYLQKRKPSSFGRVYYEGVSVQNISKELRQAMIGRGYEYDIKSAVFTWKMCFIKDACPTLKTDEQVKKAFSKTLWFLEDKQDFYHYVRRYVFIHDADSENNKDSDGLKQLHIKWIKHAITSIGFGARLNGTGWKYAGEQHYTSLAEIFKNPDERKRFVSCDAVRGFVKEQTTLDDYLFAQAKTKPEEFFGHADIRTDSGRLSKAKVIAFLYQTFETELMDLICELIEKKGKKVVARIHDAVITKRKLTVDDRLDILYQIRTQTQNPYWNISYKELQPFVYDSADPIEHEAIDINQLREWADKIMAS